MRRLLCIRSTIAIANIVNLPHKANYSSNEKTTSQSWKDFY
ncbi:Uncharacterised protein [Vibrio cholerae]|nr:Uncharacterised protein [Vibrio cholerae]